MGWWEQSILTTPIYRNTLDYHEGNWKCIGWARLVVLYQFIFLSKILRSQFSFILFVFICTHGGHFFGPLSIMPTFLSYYESMDWSEPKKKGHESCCKSKDDSSRTIQWWSLVRSFLPFSKTIMLIFAHTKTGPSYGQSWEVCTVN